MGLPDCGAVDAFAARHPKLVEKKRLIPTHSMEELCKSIAAVSLSVRFLQQLSVEHTYTCIIKHYVNSIAITDVKMKLSLARDALNAQCVHQKLCTESTYST